MGQKAGTGVELDNAALSNAPLFLDTLSYAGVPHKDVILHEGSSVELSDSYLFNLGVAPFRILHIDGGHSVEVVLHDLRVAACTLARGGILMIDDVNNGFFPGVQEAFHRFMLLERASLRPSLVPFLSAGRTYLTDEGYADRYRQTLSWKMPSLFYKHRRFMYESEVLNLGGILEPEVSIKEMLRGEQLYFPWPRLSR